MSGFMYNISGNIYTTLAQFTIGDGNPGTPTNGSTTYANPSVEGKTVKVFKNGVGYLTEGTDFSNSGGIITLLGGAVFSTGETYVIFIK